MHLGHFDINVKCTKVSMHLHVFLHVSRLWYFQRVVTQLWLMYRLWCPACMNQGYFIPDLIFCFTINWMLKNNWSTAALIIEMDLLSRFNHSAAVAAVDTSVPSTIHCNSAAHKAAFSWTSTHCIQNHYTFGYEQVLSNLTGLLEK